MGDISHNDAIPSDPVEENDDHPLEDELSPFLPTTVGRQVPLSDQATVEAKADEWGSLWEECSDYRAPCIDVSNSTIADMLPWAIRNAAAPFPVNTGLGSDNISPRAILRLSEPGLVALAALFLAFEKLGSWCSSLDLVLIVLLPKSDGGLRPIGLFPTIIRLWMRSRVCVVRAWESATALPSVFGGVGMGAQKAAFVAEAACVAKNDHIQSLLDLVKAFETVPHHILAAAAGPRSYCKILLRLSLAAYRLQRTIGIDGVFSRQLRATRGITAGSGFATSELRLLLLGTILELHIRWGATLTVKLYVDDLTLAVCGLPQVIIARMIEVLDFVIDRLENWLFMQVSAKKSKVLASKVSIAVAVTRGVKSGKVSPSVHAKLLGTDSVGGGRRSTGAFQQRLHKFVEAIPRIKSLRKVGVNSVQMVRSIGPPAILYGCETMGVSDSALSTTRSKVAVAAAPHAGGKNPDLTLLVLDGSSGTLDPAFDAHIGPVRYWALAWWKSWFDSSWLSEAFLGVNTRLSTRRSSWWSVTSGPVAALLATVRRLGWVMDTPDSVTDDLGFKWSFVLDSPMAIATACKHSVRRWRIARVGANLTGLVPAGCDVTCNDSSARAITVDMMNIVTPFLRGKAKAASDEPTWDAAWRAGLASVMCGGQWPQARKAAVPRWNIFDNRCQLCHNAVGTLEHRLACSITTPLGGWPKPPAKALRALSLLSNDRQRFLATRGLLVLKFPAPTTHREQWFQWLVEPDYNDERLVSAVWYCDGSLLHGKWLQYRSTGFGIVVATSDGDLLGYGHGAPPHWCSTAAAVETWAIQTILSVCPFPPQMRTDCQSILKIAAEGSAKATHASRQLARLWVRIDAILEQDVACLVHTGVLV